MLYKILDALHDVAAQPNGAIPPGLWQPLNDAYRDLGDVAKVAAVIDPPSPFAPGGPSVVVSPEALDESRLMENAIRQLLMGNDGTNALRDLATAGFAGPQLQYRVATIDLLHTDYVAHGRIPEIPKNDDGWLGKSRQHLRRFLASGSTVMDSLSAVPFLSMLKIPSELCSLTCEALEAQNLKPR